MQKNTFIFFLVTVLLIILFFRLSSFSSLKTNQPSSDFSQKESAKSTMNNEGFKILLPSPKRKGSLTLEEALSKRRSVRKYSSQPLSLDELSQLLWAGQGITDKSTGFKTAPSAGATYP
jgi:hypothetical protein